MMTDTEIKKAQLILVGGRPMPNILSLLYQRPQLIIAVCSLQSYDEEWPPLKRAIDNLLPSAKVETKVVDGFLLEQIEPVCESVVENLRGASWVFNITSATSIMSIGANNVAQKYASDISISCWYLDTARSRVITLAGKDADGSIFDLEVDQYVSSYGCRLVPGSLQDERQYSETHWLPFIDLLISDLYNIDVLKKLIGAISNKKPKKKDGPKELSIVDTSEEMYNLLKRALDVELITNLKRGKNCLLFTISYLQANFLEGPWLEAYVWNEARKLDKFSSCSWNQKLVADDKVDDKDNKNELDVSMIYKGQLIIVECKTGVNDGFDSDILYKIDSVANPIGNRFVGKMVVMSLPAPMPEEIGKYKTFKDFKDKARERGIEIITREKLPQIAIELRKMAESPRFNR